MKSLNAPYQHEAFHEQLVSLAEVSARSRVLDVGCGIGRTLRCAAQIAQSVTGIDADAEQLERAHTALSADIEAGRVRLQRLDVNQNGLPFEDGEFDRVVCQNVLECIKDKPPFLGQCHRVLSPGGIFLLGHHDFAGVMLNSEQPETAAEIIRAYANEQQFWMAAVDGQIGRRLPGLVSKTAFMDAVTETRHFVELEFAEDGYARGYCRQAGRVAIRAGMDPSVVEQWLNDLESLNRRGAFYFGIPWIYVRARKSPWRPAI